ncbi:MAG: response regulator transcription factor [Puia sp.]|nr:response regulator transcription factor [Puia sp.]
MNRYPISPKVLLADDHSLIRRGVRILCELKLEISEVYEVSTCHDLMMELRKGRCTHLLLDINLTDGSSFEMIPNIRSLYPKLKIAILSMQPFELYADLLSQKGISLFISKSANEEETIGLLERFFRDEKLPKTCRAAAGEPRGPFSDMTRRELEILHYMLKGLATKDIAESLGLQWNTISTVKRRIYEKTSTGNIVELKQLAVLHKVY